MACTRDTPVHLTHSRTIRPPRPPARPLSPPAHCRPTPRRQRAAARAHASMQACDTRVRHVHGIRPAGTSASRLSTSRLSVCVCERAPRRRSPPPRSPLIVLMIALAGACAGCMTLGNARAIHSPHDRRRARPPRHPSEADGVRTRPAPHQHAGRPSRRTAAGGDLPPRSSRRSASRTHDTHRLRAPTGGRC